MAIRIYDELIEGKTVVIPAKVNRPNFRVILDKPLNKVGDVLEITTTINGEIVGEPIKFIVDVAPKVGDDVVGIVSLTIVDQKSAPLPNISEQVASSWVAKSPQEKIAISELVIDELEEPKEIIKG